MSLPFSLARAAADVERSLCDFSLSFGCLPGALTHDGDDVKWCYTGLPRLNRVIGARFADAEADARIDELLAFFRGHGAPLSWFVGPADMPTDLCARLEGRGLRLRGHWTGMAFDLASLAPAERSVTGLTIVDVAGSAGDSVWASTAAEGFAMTPSSGKAFARAIVGVSERRHSSSRRFLGCLDGKPVATAALYLANGLAGIYYVSTVPAARRRGLATAMTHHALAEAAAAGYLTAVLQASPAGTPVYRAMGFISCSSIALYDYDPLES